MSDKQTEQQKAQAERWAKKKAAEDAEAAKEAERDRLAYLRRTGRKEMKP